VVIPPLTSQYLNLIKNSSLAIYIGYPDLFNVSLTIGNQTGQFVVLTGMVMVVYLAWSLLTSLIMNVIFRRVQVVER
jgi:general L-amino acid transport system permease protein